MISQNPMAEFRSECLKALTSSLEKVFPDRSFEQLNFAKPPVFEFGQLASSICFEIAKETCETPLQLANRIVESMDKAAFSLIEKVEVAGGGYINFHINFDKFSAIVIESARQLNENYGLIKVEKPQRIIVEHTSVNPVHPIHVGQARNPMLGDSIARLLSSRGHVVSRHYYVDDVGRQTAVLAYGYNKLGRPKPAEKPDHFLGKIYTITSCLVEIKRLKKELEAARALNKEDETPRLQREIDEWISVAAELKEKYPQLFDELLQKISEDEDPEKAINELNRAYEAGEEKAR
ncbi:MAG: arginine--tRNA ligase, partial [Candidatus Bathyarchaeia archaeon]